MKLYVWNEPYGVSYGGSCIYAIAESEDQARELALKAPLFNYGEHEKARVGGFELGAPTRVCDLPYAECYEWSE